MAVDTSVLDRVTNENTERNTVPFRMDMLAEEEHNARIRDTYARLINPDSRIEDVFNRVPENNIAPQERATVTPYRVENARADAYIFRADSAVNMRRENVAEQNSAQAVAEVYDEEENEDLRPTATTIQYRTLEVENTEERAQENTFSFNEKSTHKFGKREKIIVAVFVAVVVALIALVIINSAIISNLNADIAKVQDGINTVRGAFAGVNSTVEEIIHGAVAN